MIKQRLNGTNMTVGPWSTLWTGAERLARAAETDDERAAAARRPDREREAAQRRRRDRHGRPAAGRPQHRGGGRADRPSDEVADDVRGVEPAAGFAGDREQPRLIEDVG